MTIAVTLNVNTYCGMKLEYGQTYVIIEAGSIKGAFDSIVVPVNLRARFLNLGTIGLLVFAPDDFSNLGLELTGNQESVAKALNEFLKSSDEDHQMVGTALDLQTVDQYPYAFDQISISFYESLANLAIEQAFSQTQLLNQRISSVRLGAVGFQAMGGISQPLAYDKDGTHSAEANDAGPIDWFSISAGRMVESATSKNWNAWALGIGTFSRTTNLGSLQNYNSDAGGFLVGADYRWSENFVTGLYAGYDYSYTKYSGSSNMRGNNISFGAYASYEKDGYYADAVIGGGYSAYQTKRSIQFSTIDRNASADPNSAQFTAGLNLGKDFQIHKFTFGPIAGAQFTAVNIGSFTESGAESLDLALAQQNANSLRSTLGGRLAYTWNLNKKITLIPEVRMFWQHEFLNNARTMSASLDAGNDASFDYQTTAPYRDSVFAGVGATAQFGENLSGSIFYNINFGSQTYQNNTISAGLNLSF
jgi:outer membrane autotransporter protein